MKTTAPLEKFIASITPTKNLLAFALGRIRENRLTQVAGSLTFTTILALVPLLTIAFALFTAFPLFNTFRASLEAYFIQSLLPKAISSHILGYLNQFAAKASRLSMFGGVALGVTAIAILATIERAFNQIWHVKQKRPLLKRMLVYWALITLAPLLIGISLTATSYLFAATSEVVGVIPGKKMLYTLASILLTTCAFSLLYIFVPNRAVVWRDACWGGLAAGMLFELAKRIFAAFIIQMPNYTLVYGAVAVIPIFLIWVYTSWLITLFGAVLVASLPMVKYERWWHAPKLGSRFVDAMAVLEVLFHARNRSHHAGLSGWEIRKQTQLGLDELENLLMHMASVGWVGRLCADEVSAKKSALLIGAKQWVLLANPAQVRVAQVYRLFVFEVQSDAKLVQKVDKVIEQGLQESLEAYFVNHGAHLR
jgi:membrane protein